MYSRKAGIENILIYCRFMAEELGGACHLLQVPFRDPDAIYTTNPIESLNRGLKKVTKNRSVFPNEDSLFKLLYLAIGDISKKWTMRIRDWAMIFSQLNVYFEERLKKYSFV